MTNKQIFQEALIGSLNRFKNHTAIECGSRRVDYGELDRSSNLVAARLRQIGVACQTPVGIRLDDRIDIIVAVIGILKAGAIFVPLDSSLPPGRINQMIRHTNLHYVVTGGQSPAPLDPGIRTLAIRRLTADAAEEWDDACASWDGNDPIYVYFTSGSSGTPKAIVGKNKSLTHFIQWEIDTFELGEGCRVSQFITPGFDAFLRDIFVPLLSGGTICVPANLEQLLEEKHLAAWLEEERINLVHCVPRFFRMIDPRPLSSGNLPDLRTILLSGERILAGDIADWFATFASRIQLVNLYGPTETTMIKTFHLLSPQDLDKENIPVGKPMRGCRVIIFDRHMEVCDPLAIGEIYIRTPFGAHGYLNDPELNGERFIPNPLSGNPTDILYRTGDLGRYLADGSIELSGRLDRQVKIRGIRVELGEIEAILMAHPHVSEAAVLVQEVSLENHLLLAYITATPPPDQTDEAFYQEVEEYLQSRLPSAMIPNRNQRVESLPRLPNGKVDYKTLETYYQYYGKELAAPRTKAEERILAIWKHVLSHDSIGVTDNFFALGGNSLNIMALLTRIHKELDVRLPLGDMFKHRTVESQAKLVQDAVSAEFSRIPPAPQQEFYPLSPAQQRLYILQQMDPAGTSYNTPQALEFKAEPDIERLENTFHRLLARHQILRTSFHLIDGRPLQKIHPSVPFAIETESYSDGEAAIDKFLRPFSLDEAPPLRVGLLRGGDGTDILVVDMHHIITDGMSQRLLIKDFLELYAGRTLPELDIQYRDYVVWNAGEERQETIARQQEFWMDTLSGELPRINFPTDFPRPKVQSALGGCYKFFIRKETKDRLQRLAAQMDVTLYMLLLTVFNIFLSKTGNQQDILVGTPVSGRRHADLESMMGLFVNTLVMRNRVQRNESFAALLQETKKTALSAFENQEYQFEELVEKITVTRDVSRSPVFDAFFTLDTVVSDLAANYDLDMAWRDYEVKTAKFDLMLAAGVADDRLMFRFIYRTSLFKKSTIRRFSDYLNCIVDAVLNDPYATISAIDIVPPRERQLLLKDFNDTDAAIPTFPYHTHFSRQAEKTPNSVAVTCQGQTITYRELDRTSNQWANWLMAQGLEPSRPVALIIERSIRQVQAILAIWKAGCHYIPIDPNYPRQRIDTILQNAVIETIISEETINAWLQAPDQPPPANGSVHDIAYIIFTSGSTGSPKGAVVEQLGMMNHLRIKIRDFEVDQHTRLSQSASHTFDISVWQYFGPLLRGGMTIIYPNELVLDTHRYIQAVAKDGITIMQVVPSYLAVLLETLAYTPVPLPALRYLLTIGEPIKPDVVNQWLAAYPRVPMVNGYGPTEASDNVTHYFMTKPETGVDVSLGKPLPNIKVYVVDQDMKLCPIGVTGEIVISGISVGRGYINDVERTAAAFTIDPFHQDPTIRLYKTGDLGRFLEDGSLEFKGRIDYQVKIRGFRIELGEIEHALLSHSLVKEAIVVDKKDSGGRTYLCAYITCVQKAGTKELIEHLAEKLPTYMIPAFFVQLDSLPLTANGKVNRKALPDPDADDDSSLRSTTYAPPSSDMETIVAGAWRELLNIPQMGINDNFFEIGGNSLFIIQATNRLKHQLGLDIPVLKMFEYPTVKNFCNYLEELAKGNSGGQQDIAAVDTALKESLDTMEETLGIIDAYEHD